MRVYGRSGGIERVGRSLRKRPGAAAALVAGAVLAGIYLGSSTVAEIDPFYQQNREQRGSSYTSDGWRGADAVSAPSSTDQPPVDNRMSRFMSGVLALAPSSVRDIAAEVSAAREIAADVVVMGQTVSDHARRFEGATEILLPDVPPSAETTRPTSHDTGLSAGAAGPCDPAYESCSADPPSHGDDDRPYPEDAYYAYDEPAA